MDRWLVGISGDKDAMIAHLEKCEKRMLKQFAEIRAKAIVTRDESEHGRERKEMEFALDDIIALCDVYVDKRSDKQKMQDQIDELQEKIEKMEGDSECECC